MWTENSGRAWKSRAALPVLAACVLVSAVPVNIQAAGTITAIRVNGSYKPTMVWDWSQLHDPSAPLDGGKSRNTFDSPIRFFRDRSGSIYTIAANNLNYRVPMNSSFNALRALDSTDVLFDSHVQLQGQGSSHYHAVTTTDLSSGSCVEPDYDDKMWLFSLSTFDGVKYSALAHHEYYPRTCPSGGDTQDWINAIHHLTSYIGTGGTLAFRPQAYVSYDKNGGVSNSDRLVVIPRPYSTSSMSTKCFSQGAFHPSNVVQEGVFYYAIAMVAFLPATIPSQPIVCDLPAQYPGGAIPHTGGFMMIRTTHPDTPSAWQVRTDDGWSNRNVHTWQGPGGQDVTVFLPQTNWNPYRDQVTGGQNLTYSLVRHLATGKWIAFGYSNQGTLTLSYAVSNSLESPSWSPVTNVQGISPYPAPQLGSGNYPSLQSHIDGSYVFQYVDDYPFLYYVCDMKPNNGLCPGIEGADPHDRDIWRVPLHIESSGVASPVVHDASGEFSGTQGQFGWSYRASRSGLMIYDIGKTRWKSLGAPYPLVWSAGGHPGESEDAVRRWTTPGPGSVHITGRAAKSDTNGGDGVTVSIKKGPDLFIWQRDIAFGDSVGYTFALWLVVEPGEFIDFIINRGPSTVSYDSTDFHPTIEFTPY